MSSNQWPGFPGMLALILIFPLLMIAVASPAAAQSKNVYGSIFLSFDKGGTRIGTSWNYDSQAEADRAAKKYCQEDGGRNCEIGIEFENSECGALADSPNTWGAHYGSNKAEAKKKALAQCKKEFKAGDKGECKVIKVACNKDH